jgi:ABC-type amino acid transport substrate-binding protein
MKRAIFASGGVLFFTASLIFAQQATFQKVPVEIATPGGKGEAQQTAPEGSKAAEKGKTLRIISGFDSPPLSYRDGVEKKGFEVELGDALANEMGRKARWIEKNFSIPAYESELDAGDADAAMSGITITEDRERELAFSKPYLKTGFAIAANKDVDWQHNWFTTGLKKWRVGVVRDTLGDQWARDNLAAEIKTYASAERLVQALKNFTLGERGKPGFCILHDQAILLWLLSNYDYHFQIVEKDVDPQFYGIAVSKKNKELLSEINDALLRLNQNGTYRKIYQKWYNEGKDLPILNR